MGVAASRRKCGPHRIAVEAISTGAREEVAALSEPSLGLPDPIAKDTSLLGTAIARRVLAVPTFTLAVADFPARHRPRPSPDRVGHNNAHERAYRWLCVRV